VVGSPVVVEVEVVGSSVVVLEVVVLEVVVLEVVVATNGLITSHPSPRAERSAESDPSEFPAWSVISMTP